jgi:hypothetical protein
MILLLRHTKLILCTAALAIIALATPALTKADCKDTLVSLGTQVESARNARDLIALHNTSLKLLKALKPCINQAEANGNTGFLFYDEAELEIALSGLAVSYGIHALPEYQNLNTSRSFYSQMPLVYKLMIQQAARLPDPYHDHELESTRQLIVETRLAAGL